MEDIRKENERLRNTLAAFEAKTRARQIELEEMVQLQTIELTTKKKDLDKASARHRQDFKHFIQSFALVLGLRDKTAPIHAKNVAEVSVKMARSLGLSPKAVKTIMTAAVLHDSGKIGSPDITLSMDPHKMNPDELTEYNHHPIRGQMIVDKLGEMHEIGQIIRHHHEQYDGLGFPDKLKGKAIPIGARIIALADFFDETFHAHAGKDTVKRTLNAVKERVGKSFDPELYKVFKETVVAYYEKIDATSYTMEIELMPEDLRSDMVVSRDIRSGSGLMLLCKGKRLNKETIKNLERIHKFDASESGVFVWAKK